MEFPGPKAREVLEMRHKYYATNTDSSRIIVKGGDGVFVIDEDGNRFYDLHCDASVMNLGGLSPNVARAIDEQKAAGRLFTECHGSPNRPAMELAEILCEKSPVKKPSKVFFSNSGAEANEAARKLCQSYRFHKNGQKRYKIIYFSDGFAGRTKGVIAGTSSKAATRRDPFWDLSDQARSIYLSFPTEENFTALKEGLEKIDLTNFGLVDQLLVETPCQGEGGIIPVDEEALRYIYEKTQEAGILWISDAIQCGMGRTGTMFGADIYPWLKPDILTMAKALGGGLPIGATIFRADLDFQPGEHSNTFGGGPLPARCALAAFKETEELLEQGQVGMIEQVMKITLPGLVDGKCVTQTRGLGAMWAVEFSDAKLRDRLIEIGEEMVLEKGVGLRLMGAGKKSIRLMPPLIITSGQLCTAISFFIKALDKLKKEIKL